MTSTTELKPDFATILQRINGPFVVIFSRECKPVPGYPPRLFGTAGAAQREVGRLLGREMVQ